MRIKVFTLFPDMLRPMLAQSILGRAIAAGLMSLSTLPLAWSSFIDSVRELVTEFRIFMRIL